MRRGIEDLGYFFPLVWSGLIGIGPGDITDDGWLMSLPNRPRIQSVHGGYSLPPEGFVTGDIGHR